jgi:hypothetical protein
MAEKARTLYKKADAAALAVLIFEAMLLGPAGSSTVNKDDDPLTDSASLYKIDARALRTAVAKGEREKVQKKEKATGKLVARTKTVRKYHDHKTERGRPSPDGSPHFHKSPGTRKPLRLSARLSVGRSSLLSPIAPPVGVDEMSPHHAKSTHPSTP